MAYAVVQQKENSLNATDQATVASGAFGSATTAGSTLIAAVGYSQVDVTVTMNGQGSWDEVSGGGYDGTTGQGFRVFVCKNITGGSTGQITATFVGNTVAYPAIYVAELSGIDTSSPVGGSNFQVRVNPGTGSNAIVTGTITPSGQPAVLFGFALDAVGTNVVPTAGTGFTSLTASWTFAGAVSNGQLRPMHKRLTSTSGTTVTATASNGNANTFWIAGVVLLESGGGGGGGGTVVFKKSRSRLGGRVGTRQPVW